MQHIHGCDIRRLTSKGQLIIYTYTTHTPTPQVCAIGCCSETLAPQNPCMAEHTDTHTYTHTTTKRPSVKPAGTTCCSTGAWKASCRRPILALPAMAAAQRQPVLLFPVLSRQTHASFVHHPDCPHLIMTQPGAQLCGRQKPRAQYSLVCAVHSRHNGGGLYLAAQLMLCRLRPHSCRGAC